MLLTKSDLAKLAEERLGDAQVPLEASRYGAAYYLAGYAVECMVKAHIAKMTRAEQFPDKKLTDKAYKHELPALIKAAELEQQLEAQRLSNDEFGLRWELVLSWNPDVRYEPPDARGAKEAADMVEAIANARDGVLPWLKRLL